jgi:predicted glycosyltransferase
MTERTDILFYVQHLLGIGHLRRAAAIARALDARGLRVDFVSGGMPLTDLEIGGARLVQLPPLQSRDEAFSALVDDRGRAVDDDWKAARAGKLLAAFQAARPKVIMTEMFPFGRRQMRFELVPLLESARVQSPQPTVVCSVRDILNRQQKREKIDWIVDTLNRYFDRVLVHGDPHLLALDATFPDLARVNPPVEYTGYVVTTPPAAARPRKGSSPASEGGVIVSTGGGRVGEALIEAALAARPLGPLSDVPWHILIGPGLPAAAFDAHVGRAPPGMVIERARADFQDLLARSRLSISQAGYNTVLEVLRAGCPAVVVPFAAAGETEQSQRARLLADRGALTVVPESELCGDALGRGIRQALDQAKDRPDGGLSLQMDGAETTARILARILTDMLDILPG